MFADAVEIASRFTFPYVAMRRREDASVTTTLASFVVLNAEGWVVTSAHIVEELLAVHESLGSDARASGGAGPSASAVVAADEIWAIGHGAPVRLVAGAVNKAADLAIGRLEPFDPAWLPVSPVLRDPEFQAVRQGESVAFVGFPFHVIQAGWDRERGRFALAEGSFPVPRFAQDGIVSRFNRQIPEGGGPPALFIEVSTPGLRGQSGGPLVDTRGRIVGIQSRTAHLDLGFDARYTTAAGEVVVERQFMNVGLASHVDELRSMLNAADVPYTRG